jgi:hypothetical protein
MQVNGSLEKIETLLVSGAGRVSYQHGLETRTAVVDLGLS